MYDKQIVSIHGPGDWESMADAEKAISLVKSLGVDPARWAVPKETLFMLSEGTMKIQMIDGCSIEEDMRLF